MRFTSSYINGIESVDRNWALRIIVDGEVNKEGDLEALKLKDDDDVYFGFYRSHEAYKLICSCKYAFHPVAYNLIELSIQDGQSVTQKHLESVVRRVCEAVGSLWERGVDDARIYRK